MTPEERESKAWALRRSQEAFPIVVSPQEAAGGMSLWDYFAAAALQTMKFSPWTDNPLYWEGVARSAAEAADAMMIEREKRLALPKHESSCDGRSKHTAGGAAVGAKAMSAGHCRDCCCARSWEALGISSYTGKSIPEHIAELRGLLTEYVAWRGRSGFRHDEWERRVNAALISSVSSPSQE